MSDGRSTILVTGDVTIDHQIYAGERDHPRQIHARGVVSRCDMGGACLLDLLLRATLIEAGSADWRVDFGLEDGGLLDLPDAFHMHAIWQPFPTVAGDSASHVWRVGQTLGYGSGPFPVRIGAKRRAATPHPRMIVMDDAGLGFRWEPASPSWPLDFAQATRLPEWIVLKIVAPIAQGDLWRAIVGVGGVSGNPDTAGRLVVVLSVDSLRAEGALISRGISWERTVEDLMGELEGHPALKELRACRHLIVTFRTDGALWIERVSDRAEARLFFDPETIEGEWERGRPGAMPGGLSCFVAGLAYYLRNGPNEIGAGVRAGLSALRELQAAGHGPIDGGTPGFPMKRVTQAILTAPQDFACTLVPEFGRLRHLAGKEWMMPGFDHETEFATPLYGLATRIARFGVETMANLPCLRIGNLVTVDRHEIEGIRHIKQLLLDYVEATDSERPLSLAVFGPPGAGKSFAIKELARALLGKTVPLLVFNLSQFASGNDFVGALHQVRDKVLEGRMPVVFWDEFDTHSYEWLQCFLAPMQDGKFQEGQITHPIGKCVFVFAGGTSPDFDHFGPSSRNADAVLDFSLKKGPDFLSRVTGTLNILGPNPRMLYEETTGHWKDDPHDICFPVRRAVFLRAKLGREEGETLDIDPGLLAAILEVERYRNGARSLEKLATHLRRKGSTSIRLSHLPHREELSLLVDYEALVSIIDRFATFRARAAEMAPAVHEGWRRQIARDKDGTNPSHEEYLAAYATLPPHAKSDNISAALRIPEILALVGLFVVPSDAAIATDGAAIAKVLRDHSELLARAEHDGWVEAKRRDGWTFGTRLDAALIHDRLCPYEELPEAEKDKDRTAVRLYPEVVRLAGFKIVPRLS